MVSFSLLYTMTEHDLNAAQRKVFDELLDAGSPEVSADPELRHRLVSSIEARVESSVQRWDKVSDDRLWIGKTT